MTPRRPLRDARLGKPNLSVPVPRMASGMDLPGMWQAAQLLPCGNVNRSALLNSD
jgi:hypothetical protein